MTNNVLGQFSIAPGDLVIAFWKGAVIYVERRVKNKRPQLIGSFQEPDRAIRYANEYARVEAAQMKASTRGVSF